MSNKPKIYGYCKAGCGWETVHKSDFEASASHIPVPIGDDGTYNLELGKEYKIFAPKTTNEAGTDYGCEIKVYYSTGAAYYTTLDCHSDDVFADDYFTFRFLALQNDSEKNLCRFVYEIAGVRYEKTMAYFAYINLDAIEVSGATKVLRFNSDAQIVAKGEKGDTPFIGDNGNWWIGEEDTGVAASGGGGGGAGVTVVQEKGESTAAVMSQKAVTEELNKKQDVLTFDETPMVASKNLVTSGGIYNALQNIRPVINVNSNTSVNLSSFGLTPRTEMYCTAEALERLDLYLVNGTNYGDMFYVTFNSGATPTTLFVDSTNTVFEEFAPSANSVVEICGKWNGSKWIILFSETAVA